MGIQVQEIALDIAKDASTELVYLGQGDANATTLRVSVYDKGQAFSLSGYSVRFCMQLPHRGGSYEVDGTASGNVATFDIDETLAAAVSGRSGIAFVQVLSGSTVVCSTSRAGVVVRPSHSDGVPPAKAWDNGVEAFLAQARDDLDEAIDEAAETASEHQAVAIAAKVPWPLQSGGSGADSGSAGQLLESNGDGTTYWGVAGTAQIGDGAVTYAKLSGAARLTAAQIDAMF